jgi:hypothetical protein
MTRELDFSIATWLPGSSPIATDRETLASLSILAGSPRMPVTEVEDQAAHTMRRHINVPAYSVAQWLLMNFWRLRWEPARPTLSPDWLESHSMAGISGDHAWPPLEFASDGEFMQLRLQAEPTSDVAAVRYVRDVKTDIPAADFESAVIDFVGEVEARIAAVLPGQRELAELREELEAERRDPALAATCKLQALAGIDPGSAPPDWLSAVEKLAAEVGETATDELLAVSPAIPGGLSALESAVAAMRDATTTVRLDWATLRPPTPRASEPPWSRGERTAADLRARLGIEPGPISSALLEQLLEARLPLPKSANLDSPELSGAYRNGQAGGRTALLVPTAYPKNQRFYLARLIAATLHASPDQHVLPVSKAGTALQKLERAFAAEFLCPWRDLDAFTDERGTDDEGIAEAAAHFDVSELLVLSSLVNKGKVQRSRLVEGQ